MTTVLLEHGTRFMRLKPVNIAQAARADLRLLELKSQRKADEDRPYTFARKHVRKARDYVHLIAIAFFENAPKTDKRSTMIAYRDRELLRETLIELLQQKAELPE